MIYLSVCSGIEAATVAWHPLGWEPVAFSEIEPFPSAVLAHHWRDVPNLGDMTLYENWKLRRNPHVLVGGTPCQSYSIAGLREGLDSVNGRLMLTYVEIAAKYRPRWLVWENVPGCLSSADGKDFATFLGSLTGREINVPCDGWKNSGYVEGIPEAYGVAWRVLDAQYFGVAQRRRRVFVIGYLGDWRRAAAVLFEQASMCGNPAPSREKGQGITGDTEAGVGANSRQWPARVAASLRRENGAPGQSNQDIFSQNGANLVPDIIPPLTTRVYADNKSKEGQLVPEVANPLTARMHKGINTTCDEGQTPIVVHGSQDPVISENHAHALGRNQGLENVVAFTQNQRDEVREVDVPGALAANPGMKQQTYLAEQVSCADVHDTLSVGANQTTGRETEAVYAQMQVRRLTPVECERLQGFPDHHTLIPGWTTNRKEDDFRESVQWHMHNGHTKEDAETFANHPDGHRYKACGNSMAVPVIRWIGERIQLVEEDGHE